MVDISSGKKIRSPSLERGNIYIARFWAKVPTFHEVRFMGFFADGVEHAKPPRQLKDMLKTDVYKFVMVSDGSTFEAFMQDMCLVHSETKGRLTFTMPVGTADATATTEVTPVVSTAAEAAEEAAQPAEITEPTEASGSYAELDAVAEEIAQEATEIEAADTVTQEEPEEQVTATPVRPLDAFVMPAETPEDEANSAEATEEAATSSEDSSESVEAADENDASDDTAEGDEPVFINTLPEGTVPDNETPAERKRRLDAQRKREKRAAARAMEADQPNA